MEIMRAIKSHMVGSIITHTTGKWDMTLMVEVMEGACLLILNELDYEVYNRSYPGGASLISSHRILPPRNHSVKLWKLPITGNK
uniref:Uncharacterized protein n=1 Tax=Kalanchoe fedtschenkoi TaxID=63787 RepID=A0A7N1A6A4_KALFE